MHNFSKSLRFVSSTSRRLLLALALSCLAQTAYAAPITVVIDTSAIAGTSAQLAFDFLDGGGPSNSIEIVGFSTDGTLGASSSIGGVTGTLPGPVTLTDTDFFNELLTAFVVGTTLSFTFESTGLGGDPADQFSVFLLNETATAPLFATTDPTGANALLAFDVFDENGTLWLFSAIGGEVTVTTPSSTPVPEPGTLVLTALGAALMRASRRRKRA